jgi:hypothetical protein
MLAVCLVMGIAPVIPKRKDQFAIEIEAEEEEAKDDAPTIILSEIKD